MPVEVPKGRPRILKYSHAFMGCTAQAAAYGKCITTKGSIKQGECEKEFLLLRECMRSGLKKVK